MIDPHIQKAMALADEYAAQETIRWNQELSGTTRLALESHLLALVERVRKETKQEVAALRHEISTRDVGLDTPFTQWTRTQPAARWAKYDLHACALGWNAAIDRALASPVEKL